VRDLARMVNSAADGYPIGQPLAGFAPGLAPGVRPSNPQDPARRRVPRPGATTPTLPGVYQLPGLSRPGPAAGPRPGHDDLRTGDQVLQPAGSPSTRPPGAASTSPACSLSGTRPATPPACPLRRCRESSPARAAAHHLQAATR
jgi:hypothetical protein